MELTKGHGREEKTVRKSVVWLVKKLFQFCHNYTMVVTLWELKLEHVKYGLSRVQNGGVKLSSCSCLAVQHEEPAVGCGEGERKGTAAGLVAYC